MKALTLYQPYALFTVTGEKEFETRPRKTHIRGTIAIHAGKKPVAKVLESLPQHMRHKIEAYMQEKYGHAYSITRSETEYLEIFSRRADKGVALLRLADSLGIPRDRVFAVGDHCNDLPLLKAAAGAFVPENGLPAVKALGQTVASCDGHAVADVIRRLGAIL